jgi:hypothetical protein
MIISLSRESDRGGFHCLAAPGDPTARGPCGDSAISPRFVHAHRWEGNSIGKPALLGAP